MILDNQKLVNLEPSLVCFNLRLLHSLSAELLLPLLLRILLQILLQLLFLAGGIQPSFAYYQDYLPAKMLSAKPIAQKVIALDFDHDWKAEVLPGIVASNYEGQFTVCGRDGKGSPWKISESEPRDFGGSCYIADVDGNGKLDILFHFPNASCGYPFSSLVVLFIDQSGLPHREEVVSRFSAGKSGVSDIVRGTSGKGALILQQDLAYGTFNNRDCGYWRWSALLAENCKLTVVKSAFDIELPCFVFFTTKPNHRLSRHGAALECQFRKHQ